MGASWPLESSPFVFEGPMPADRVVGRDQEVASLRAAADAGRSICLIAPRRYGKTSLLGRVAHELGGDGTAAVIVDLYGTHSLADLAVRLERAYSAHLRGRVRALVTRLLSASGLGLSLSAGGIGVQFQRQPRSDPLPALHALLDLPRRVAEDGARSWVVLDEFQAVLHIKDAEAILRSHVQHHRGVASYVFAGSEPGMLERLFTDRSRPFYGQADIRRLERLDDAPLAAAIEDGFATTERSAGDVLGDLLAVAQGHPQRAMLLAHHLWHATGHGQIAGAVEWSEALDQVLTRTRLESETRFRALSPNQQRVLRALAGWGSPYARAALAQVGLEEGNVGAVLRQMVAAGDLEHLESGYRFVDPLLHLWVAQTFGYA
jgi:uncharacterized protein